MALFGIKKCERCGKILFFKPVMCASCGLPVVDRSGDGFDISRDIAPGLRKTFDKYRNAGFVVIKRDGDLVVMNHRAMKSGAVTRLRYIEYIGYFAISMGTFYLFDKDFISGVICLSLGAFLLYYDYRKKLVTISLDESGKVVEKGNVIK